MRIGGLYVVVLFGVDGVMFVVCEDIGWYNVVDKVIGWVFECD